ncbi:aldo/keto reductase [Mucilaginibacter gotjawali]|uniref:Aryl-alcohol dehydrogenase-like predicted oxidoreductase n=2 Tax=Mucilaginibacter gotjawali TaxID=1550579 RepID=A0A839S6J3_9SPHI|nr:aldo/keto reductase [Mucilaginibacter gotjawali]MBB3053711.1 aryl-alcohol dehydrogenase-like predicted oxidoreductase [Mucilaginibacter gotjawali]BAU53970.1 General stress protein 69 [Mucilaginibacter gotjawali]
MKYNFLGNTGLVVSELCFGTMTFGGKGYWEAIGKVQQSDVNDLMKVVVDSGINFIDTANVYSYGESEKLLGQSIKHLGTNRHDLVIATKVRGRMSEGLNNVGLSRYHIFQSVDESLQRLQMDHVDVLYVHGVDPKTPVEEIMRALNDIVLTGKVRYVAVCNWPAWMVMKAQGIAEKNGWNKFVGMQYFYSLAGRDIEREILPLAADQNLAVMPWSPLAGGFLGGKYSRDADTATGSRRATFDFPPINKEKTYDIIDVITEIGKQHNASVAEIALAWVRQQKGITSTIIGAKTADQLNANIKSTEVELSADDLQKIDEVSALPREYPGWMVERQSADRALKS